MAKKQNKSQAALNVKIEERYIRGIALEIIAFLTLFFMPQTLAVRLVSILLIAIGMSNKKVARIVSCSERTVSNLRGLMQYDPVACLMVIKKGSGRKSKVGQSMADQIAEDVRRARYSTLRQIAKMIKKSYGITISESSVMPLLRKYNIRKLKSVSVPAKTDPEAQRKFYEETLHPLMEKAKDGSATLYFMDALHFIMGSDYTGSFYGDERKLNKTLSGRQRYNVLGCLDFVSK